jgi:hypothetical protein
MREVLRMASADDPTEYCAWLTKQDKLRTASHRGELRTGIHYLEDDLKRPPVRTLSVRERIAHHIQGYGTVVDETPDGYRTALENRTPTQHDVEPDFDPNYNSRGTPPNGYALALALRQLANEDATPARAEALPAMLRDENGTPDPYKTALAARSDR